MLKILKKRGAPFYAIYLATFLFTFHISLSIYINSSFLGQFLSDTAIGFVYITASILALFTLAKFPYILSRFGNYKTIITLFALQFIFLGALAFTTTGIFAIPIFIITQVLITLVFLNFDVFLEAFSEDKSTGTIRGIMLTVINFAVLLGPIITGVILSNGNFGKIYLIAALFIIPALFVVGGNLKNFKDPQYDRVPFWKNLKDLLVAHHPNDQIRHAIISALILRFFFAWMVIYTPIYLNKYIGFDWSEIGIILTIMLLPFVLFELPIGRLIDKKTQEKPFMMVGFFIIALFTASLFFVESQSLFVWAALLFGTRIGASFVEITTESYFFKHIDGTDTNTLSVFRNTRPIAYIAGPLLASTLLLIMPMQALFLVLAFIVLLGIWNSAMMKDVQKNLS